jgi:PAS domain S-box-containing protein
MELDTNKGFSFSRNEFIKICPFFFSFDENLIVKDSGTAVSKVFGNVKDIKLFDIVALEIDEKSPIQSFESLKKLVHTTIFFKPAKFNDKSRFKGQLVNADNSDLLLIFFPIIEQIEDLESLNLVETDFAPHDIITAFQSFLKNSNVFQDASIYQEELLTANYRLNSLLNTMQSGVIAEDADRKVLLVNTKFCSMFSVGLQPEDIKGLDCNDLLFQAKSLFIDEEGFLEDIQILVKNRKEVFGDILHMKNGNILERDYVPIIESGRFLGQIWRYQNITNIVNQKKSLLRIEEKYRRIIEDLEFGLIEVDLNQNITKAYPAFCRMTEYEEEELIGKNAKILLLDPEFEDVIETQNESRINGESSVYEIKIRTKSNQPKWVIISGTPIYNERNEIIGSIGIHIDITERKDLEEALKVANDKAIFSVKAKELFIANMSHEIRTPMNVIIGMTDVLKSTLLDKESLRYLNAIEHSAENLLRLINEILDISKAESGSISLFPEPTNFKSLIDEFSISFGEYAKKKGLSFEVLADQNISSSLMVDQVKLNQVLVNLIGNGIKFTEKGKVSLNVSVIQDEIDQQTIKIAISDSGIGIKKENFEAIFESFRQEDESIGKKFGGTGLGLSISQAIVRKMGGEIELISELGEGTTFFFTIILDKIAEEVNLSAVENELQISNVLATKTILVAEDDELNQLLIKAIFEKFKVPFTIANNGKEVLELLKLEHFDMILMDIEMPELNGLETTKFIRQQLKIEIPIIALTAHESENDKRLFESIGMNDYVTKPFKKEMLLNVISRQFEIKNEKDISFQSESLSNTEPLYNLNTLREMSQGDKGFLTSIVETFIQNTPIYLDQIKTGFQANDLNMVYRAAHQMKPSIDFFNVEKGKTVVRAIELEAKNDNANQSNLGELITTLNHIVNSCVFDLKKELVKGL